MNTAATPIPTSSRALEATRWRIDPARSSVSFQTPTNKRRLDVAK